MKIARLTVPNDRDYLAMVTAFVRENATLIGFDEADRLELQYLNNVLIDYERIQLYSDFARDLLAFIRGRDPIRHAL